MSNVIQFHFATVLSPWIRRALVAGGFGIGRSSSRAPAELVQVVSYGDVRAPSLPREKLDIENAIVEEDAWRPGSASKAIPTEEEPIALQETPFFHFDVVSAVRAAESGLRRTNSTPSVASVSTGKQVDGSS